MKIVRSVVVHIPSLGRDKWGISWSGIEGHLEISDYRTTCTKSQEIWICDRYIASVGICFYEWVEFEKEISEFTVLKGIKVGKIYWYG